MSSRLRRAFLRALAGAVVIHVALSHWLLVRRSARAPCVSKRRRSWSARPITPEPLGHAEHYSAPLLDHLTSIIAAATIVAYAFYTISPETVAKFGTDRLLFTLPFPIYGIFRYLYLIHRRQGGGNPSEALLTDGPLLICVVLWVAGLVAILYGPWRGMAA